MCCLSDLSGCELVALANLVAIYIASNVDEQELAVLATFFTSVGDNLALIATAKL